MPKQNFLGPEFGTEFRREVRLFFVDTWISLEYSVERSLHAKNELDPSNRFDGTPTCDRQTDRHKAIASTRDSIASRG